MIDYVTATAEESARFGAALERAVTAGTPLDGPRVPTCPDWSLADLAWHLTEVQHFWAAMVGRGLDSPAEYERPDRPPTDGLPTVFSETSAGLVEALGRADPGQPCWTWHPRGDTAAWVRRRQAHEALIHRIDAELAVVPIDGSSVTSSDPVLAADGVDEMLTVMLDASHPPSWATWQPDGRTARLQAVVDGGADRAWRLDLGRLVGEGDGTEQDREALVVREVDAGDGGPADASLRAPADELNRWIWGRGPLGPDALVGGDRAVAEQIRAIAQAE